MNIPVIQNLMAGRNNNFDLIRLIAAVTVIFSHSFPISFGKINGEDSDPLFQHTGQISMGHIAVMIFFIVSGFLITQSYDRSNKPIQYLKSRILRIFPGLFFSVFVTVFILGALVTTLPIKQYLTSTSTYHFLENLTLYINVYVLPGVFQHNAYANAVNGSLWTLMYEFSFYILVLDLGLVRLLRKEIIVIIFIVSTVSMRLEGLGAEMLMFFTAGMLFYIFRQEIKMKLNIAVVSIAIIIFCLIFYRGLCLPVITICLSYAVVYFAYAVKTKINASKYGDLSYGTYIFAFPIQQSVTFYLGGSMHWWDNFLISLPLTLLMALMSWHLVEKNALKLKRTQFIKIKIFDRAS